jgi:ATP-dependent Clp protease protease subunit
MLTTLKNDATARMAADAWNKPLDKQGWYDVKAEGEHTEILIYDVIGWPFVEAAEFVRDLQSVNTDKLTVRLNSPGGDVMDGLAIYNALKQHKAEVTTRIEGWAASIASIIALAGDKREIASNGYYMIHNPWLIAMGDYRDMGKAQDLLGKITDTLARTYAEHSSMGVRKLKQAMDDETWYTASEAVEAGFVDSISGSTAKARFDVPFANAPASDREIERILREAGKSRAEAKKEVAERRQRDAVSAAMIELTNKLKRK